MEDNKTRVVAANAQAVDVTDVKAVLHYTQSLRMRGVDMMTNGGTEIPEDFTALQGLLQHVDNTALMTRKLDIEESTGAASKALLDTLESLERRVAQSRGGAKPIRDITPPPEFKLGLPEVDLAEGEDRQNEETLAVGDFLPNEQ